MFFPSFLPQDSSLFCKVRAFERENQVEQFRFFLFFIKFVEPEYGSLIVNKVKMKIEGKHELNENILKLFHIELTMIIVEIDFRFPKGVLVTEEEADGGE